MRSEYPQIITALTVSLITFSSGILSGWSSPSIPKLLSDDFPIKISSEQASYLVVIPFLIQIIGGLAFSILADKIGRKFSILLSGPLYAISFILIRFSSSSIVFLYLSRIIGGFAEGYRLVILLYIPEISEPKIRGALTTLFTIYFTLGVLFINVIGFYYSIETTSLIISVFPIIFLVLFAFMPESPYFYLMKHNVEDAKKSLKFLRWSDDIDEELSQIQSYVSQNLSEKGRFQDLILVKSNRRTFLMMCFLHIAVVFAGPNAITMYAQTFFVETTNVLTKEWAAVLQQVIILVTICVISFLVDSVGKRPFFLTGTAGGFISLTATSIFLFLKNYGFREVKIFNWMALIGIFLSGIFFMILQTVAVCLVGEIFPLKIKAKGCYVLFIVFSLYNFAGTKLYQYLSDNYTVWLPLLIFGVIQFWGLLYCYWCVPETKKKTFGEIQDELKTT